MKHFEGDLVYSPQTILPKNYCFGQSRFFLTRFYGKSPKGSERLLSNNERWTCLASVPIEPSLLFTKAQNTSKHNVLL